MKHRVRGLPPTVRVGLQNYRIEMMDPSDERYEDTLGYCWPDERVIRLKAEQREASDAVDTLIHEILHATFYAFHIDPENPAGDEATVHRLGTALATVFRDNPQLLKWIGRTL